MRLELKVAKEYDFLALIMAEWDAFENPLQPVFHLYCPVTDNDRAESIVKSAARQLEGSKTQDPNVTSIWVKVVDADSMGDHEKIVGGAQWVFVTHHAASVEDEVGSLAELHPEGGARIFAAQAFALLRGAESHNRHMHGAQHYYASLGSCFTIPEYRRHGVGSLLMKWGLQQVDERGMDTWIEAALAAVPFYESHGFVQKQVLQLDFQRPKELSGNHAAEWEATAKSILPLTAVCMCRPVRNVDLHLQ